MWSSSSSSSSTAVDPKVLAEAEAKAAKAEAAAAAAEKKAELAAAKAAKRPKVFIWDDGCGDALYSSMQVLDAMYDDVYDYRAWLSNPDMKELEEREMVRRRAAARGVPLPDPISLQLAGTRVGGSYAISTSASASELSSTSASTPTPDHLELVPMDSARFPPLVEFTVAKGAASAAEKARAKAVAHSASAAKVVEDLKKEVAVAEQELMTISSSEASTTSSTVEGGGEGGGEKEEKKEKLESLRRDLAEAQEEEAAAAKAAMKADGEPQVSRSSTLTARIP